MSADAFISYAGEDTQLAQGLATELGWRGFQVWFAPLSLTIGSSLLGSIEKGMADSATGILLLSKAYLSKGWPSAEMDSLLRAYIENRKRVFPVWVDITVADIRDRHPVLAGIVAARLEGDVAPVAMRIARELSGNAPTVAVFPSWESPAYRFLQGRGEIHLDHAAGATASLWELLLHLPAEKYPIYIAGRRYSKNELVLEAAQLILHIPDVARGYVGSTGIDSIIELCKREGFDPQKLS